MKIKLSDHFSYKKLFLFTLPTIATMIFTSIYGIVDGFFVSNFVGKTPFAAVNFIMPFLIILGAPGFMFGAGGSALISKTMGAGDKERANRLFSFFTYVSIVTGVVIAAIGIAFIRPVASVLGAEGELLENCVIYGRIILFALPAFMLQVEFQTFFITAEKPQVGLVVTFISGVANMVLDALLVAVFEFGIVGAACATAISQCIGGIIPIIYFSRKNKSLLKLSGTRFEGMALLKACTNGSSELLSNIAFSFVGILYNIQLLKYAGENGVAAYGVLMYVGMIFSAIFIGYSIGTAPVVGFHYGAANKEELRSILRKSTVIILVCSVLMVIASVLLAHPLSVMFVGYDAELLDLTAQGFYIYSLSFLFAGFAIFASSFFTALNDGITSAIISFLRTLVFQTVAILTLPLIWEMNGVWLSLVVAELMAFVIAWSLLVLKRKKYGYFGD